MKSISIINRNQFKENSNYFILAGPFGESFDSFFYLAAPRGLVASGSLFYTGGSQLKR